MLQNLVFAPGFGKHLRQADSADAGQHASASPYTELYTMNVVLPWPPSFPAHLETHESQVADSRMQPNEGSNHTAQATRGHKHNAGARPRMHASPYYWPTSR